ncbi:MAG: hypothetical protein EAZ52_04140 [Alphaproteobacteria bacterium]|nr:MAG: hypothetical protein EAZ52_04140 [Alphaproteobacteria bacterium]
MVGESLTHNYGLCERESLAWFAEPLNVISSLLFFVVAIMVFRYMRRFQEDLHGYKIYDLHAMNALIFMIGIGSTLYHVHPTPTTELIDMIPIVSFIVVFFLSAMRRIVKCSMFETMICFLAFGGGTHILVDQFPQAMNDSIGYFSSMASLVAIAFYLNIKRRRTAQAFLVAALIGVISLFFRSVDTALCDMFPMGTHFLWHSCNALLIYILMVQMVRNVNRRARLMRQASAHFV